MWPSKLRGGAEEDDDDSDSVLGIDTDPIHSIQQKLEEMTLTRLARKKREVDFEIEGGTPPKDRRVTDDQQDRMTDLFGRVSSPKNVRPPAPRVKLPFKTPPSAYQRASLQKMTDQLRREEEKANRTQIDQPPIFRHALRPQQPVSSINIPRRNLQTPPLSDEEFAILMAGQDPRPRQSRTFNQYLEEIGRGAIRTDQPVRSHQPPRHPALYKRK